MKANSANFSITKGEAFEAILEYREDSKRVFTDYANHVFKGQIRSSREVTGTLFATLSIVVTGLGQIKVSLTSGQTTALSVGNSVYDILVSDNGVHDPEIIYTGNVVTANPIVAATPKTATIWENVAPTTAITPSAGPVALNSTITLSTEEGAKTYYTKNGSTPTAILANLYSGPVTISGACTVKFFSVDQAGNIETVKSAAFTIAA